MEIVKFDNVTRIYTNGEHEQRALDDVSFSLDEGKFVVILGPSGAGKSTLLNLLGGLDSPTSGTISVKGKDISKLSDNELADYRASTVGFVCEHWNPSSKVGGLPATHLVRGFIICFFDLYLANISL